MALTKQEALDQLRAAVTAQGGPGKVAARVGIQRSHLSAILWGKRGMGRESLTKLQSVIELYPETWLALVSGDLVAEARP